MQALLDEGPWHVRSGTGAYARMTGGGTFLAHIDVRSGVPVFTINRMEAPSTRADERDPSGTGIARTAGSNSQYVTRRPPRFP